MSRQKTIGRTLAILISIIVIGVVIATQIKDGGEAQAKEAAVEVGQEAEGAQAAPVAKGTPVGTIVVPVSNLQNFGKGQLLAILYKEVDRVEVGKPYFRRVVVPVEGKDLTVTFKDVPYGDYAVAIMHDMDKDLEMDTNFIGIPDEDLGISNNVKGGPAGGPKWDKAKFAHEAAENRLTEIKIWQCYD